MIKFKLEFLSAIYMLILLSESYQYYGVQNEKSKLALKYIMMGFFL